MLPSVLCNCSNDLYSMRPDRQCRACSIYVLHYSEVHYFAEGQLRFTRPKADASCHYPLSTYNVVHMGVDQFLFCSCCAGKTLESTGELTGTEAPSLMTIGRDGAVFFWVYEALPQPMYPHPKRFGNIPGKRRKRKAPDTDPEADDKDPEADGEAAHTAASIRASEDGDSSSGESDQSSDGIAVPRLLSSSESEAEMDAASKGAKHKGRGTEPENSAEAAVDRSGEEAQVGEDAGLEGKAEANRQMQASTSGRQEDEQSQSTSYAGMASSAAKHFRYVWAI